MRGKIIRKPEESKIKLKKVVPDTSILVSGKLSYLLEEGKMKNSEIIIPEIVMGELQAQASRMKESGFLGLEEIKKIRSLLKKNKAKLRIIGELPSHEDIMLAKSGRLDALIQKVAKNEKAVLITGDLPQALMAEAHDIPVKYFQSYKIVKKLKIEKLLTKETMSLHLKEGTYPLAKRGKPGKIDLVKIGKKKLKASDVEEFIDEIFEVARISNDAFVEFNDRGASVVQIRDMRVAIARPPFSDGLELTVVRPIVKLTLDDYKLSDKLKERLDKKAEGVLLAGSPGSGKSTFAASLAEFYLSKGKIVKTIESPKDLQVPAEVTQYGPLNNSFEKTADILLLVRPDYTIFDEIRKRKDFQVFADMRLAGIGMIGVIHASDPIDATQRFLGKIELGVIPHVIDTIVYIKDGKVAKVYKLSLVVKVPSGMTEADLARPMVEIRDFEDDKLEYEIYTYGEQTVVVPVGEEKENSLQKLAGEQIREVFRDFDPRATVEFVSDNRVLVRVDNEIIPQVIGREGKTIKKLEEEIGLSIDIEPAVKSLGKEVKGYGVSETGAFLVFRFKKKISDENVNIYVDDDYVMSATVGRKGEVKVKKKSDVGRYILRALTGKGKLKVFI
ncbi:MAG: Flp pilus assembly complex ATPase component TadA [Candidatus Aenigmarchaeota archaeon]|nr:Flp pilus assembly complex ATPase component TadA [Candidatus Aenigmarchaeota archaeon]